VHARLLPRLSRSCTLLLPNDIHRKPITSITAVLLPFVTFAESPSYDKLKNFEQIFENSYGSIIIIIIIIIMEKPP
jgi:hypothetical protein